MRYAFALSKKSIELKKENGGTNGQSVHCRVCSLWPYGHWVALHTIRRLRKNAIAYSLMTKSRHVVGMLHFRGQDQRDLA